jgi:hypothetical protein
LQTIETYFATHAIVKCVGEFSPVIALKGCLIDPLNRPLSIFYTENDLATLIICKGSNRLYTIIEKIIGKR